ncbi:DUF4269 domain-containing protein [Ornithinibacillus sp. BX22]|uniref:DUF4269 domain-containing protein n=1 Tax=Ornithinibacillus hominis TaxID=2763055 RepID=A0A923L4R6_9BACI|nr:DUF4269 domain-containing protein [Ornithinibacillus hominis]MBC5636468.1 DUF4269 domain-containing protein [Ornithinibacillus hominis]
MFDSLKVLKAGSKRQQKAYDAIRKLNVLQDLAPYHPVLCGTLPLGIDVEQSDLDIIMEVHDYQGFTKKLISLYQDKKDFRWKETEIRGERVIKANFHYFGFDFELFGQAVPTDKQNAYRHMVIEHKLLEEYPQIKEQVIQLKQQGVKTEPAFCQVLGIQGNDPYKDLLVYGKAIFGG